MDMLGHNNPPTDAEMIRENLAEKNAKAIKRDAELAEASRLEQEGKLSQADAKVEKAIVHDHDAAFFGVAAQEKGASVAASTGELTGARSSLRYTWTGEILDANNTALRDALWNLVPLDAKQKALNTFVKLGGREVGGAKICEKPEATTR